MTDYLKEHYSDIFNQIFFRSTDAKIDIQLKNRIFSLVFLGGLNHVLGY